MTFTQKVALLVNCIIHSSIVFSNKNSQRNTTCHILTTTREKMQDLLVFNKLVSHFTFFSMLSH